MPELKKHKVLVVGGGYAGVRAARVLAQDKRYDTTLVSDSLYFRRYAQFVDTRKTRFQPLLKLDMMFSHKRLDIDLVRARITRFKPSEQVVLSDKGIEYSYDSLILALGRVGRPNTWQQAGRVYSAYSYVDMNDLKRRMEADVESGRGVRYVVVGAGETGVELAAELRVFANDLARQYERHHSLVQVIILEHKSRILPDESITQELRKKILHRLRSLGIMILTDTRAGEQSLRKLRTTDSAGSYDDQVVIQANTSIVNPFFIANREHFSLAQNTLVRASSLLEADGHNNVYVIGDCVDTERPGTVASAVYDADFVVSVLAHKFDGKDHKHYEPSDRSVALELGKRWAIVKHGGRVSQGKVGWLLKRWIDLKHFSTLVPKRIFIRRIIRGSSKHN